ncbi:hypothetical protein ACB098_02G116100 [Castanea mollissima]
MFHYIVSSYAHAHHKGTVFSNTNFETNPKQEFFYFETPNPNSIFQTLKPKSTKSPNPSTITNEGTFSTNKKEKIEQINRKWVSKRGWSLKLKPWWFSLERKAEGERARPTWAELEVPIATMVV